MIDPAVPTATDLDILSHLIENLTTIDKFYQQTDRLAGRWILIANDRQKITLFNDAAGLRQVFFTDIQYVDELWCASQPRILAELLNLKMSNDAVDFINSYNFRKNIEFRWPGDGSPYNEIKHLLPNHSLNLNTGMPCRYWPVKPIQDLSLEEGIARISIDLPKLMEGASNRFDLALSLTAGLDSRIVLAASKNIKDEVSFMTVRQFNQPDTHMDIAIPSKILSGLGLQHDVVQSSYIIDDEFLNFFKKNTSLPHYVYIPDAYAILNFYHQEKVAVTGSVSEIARSAFRAQLGKPDTEIVTAYDLARLQKMGKNGYALKSFENWLADLERSYNIDPLVLFEWEQAHGNWLAMCQLEFDIAWKDLFTPFNCRQLLVDFLSVKEEHRKNPKNALYKRLILILWPELLQVPINPHEKAKKNFSVKVKSSIPYGLKKKLKKILYPQN